MRHEFLVLSLLLLLPWALFAAVRPDLRGHMARTALASLPFAATESLFYPAYWQPHFLFDLADVLGFGVEDVLFVAGLGALACAAYPVAFRRAVVPLAPAPRRPWARALGAVGLAVAGALGLLALGVPVLYAAVAAMAAGTAGMLAARRDLLGPALLGAALTGLAYWGLCLLFALLVPGVFARTWRPSVLLPGHLLGVPLDEVLYGVGAGLGGTAFPAWAFGRRFSRAAAAPRA